MGARVLLVDDDPVILGVVKLRLEQRGYHVATAGSALSAERVAIREQPELALLDVVMPGLNGLELCRRLLHNPDLPPQMRVVMLSSVTDPEVLDEAKEAGATGYIVKSNDINAIIEQVVGLLDGMTGEMGDSRALYFQRLRAAKSPPRRSGGGWGTKACGREPAAPHSSAPRHRSRRDER